MVIKYYLPQGTPVFEPPYTAEENDEFYRRVGSGPVAIFHSGRRGRTPPEEASATSEPPPQSQAAPSPSADRPQGTKPSRSRQR